MIKIQNLILLPLLLSLLSTPLNAQGRFNIGMGIKNMHYWRGLRVSDGFVTAPMVGYYNGGFSVFTWAGMSVDGDYREVSQIVSYSAGNFNITLLDIFNFSGLPEFDYFNFDPDETNHITDISVSYDYTESIPLRTTLATIIYGNDRNADGSNRFSSYLRLGVPFAREGFEVEPFVAAGYALNPKDETSLYGNAPFAIVNIGIKVAKEIRIGDIIIPIAGVTGFNPSLKQASAEVAISLF